MIKLEKKFLKAHKHQEIVITGSPLFSILETIGVWLHIAAFIIGLATFFGFFSKETEHGEEVFRILEATTLIIVGLIILQFTITPFLERIMVKSLLKEFWGTNDIATSLKYATGVDTMTNFGVITSEVESLQLEKTKLDWNVVSLFPFKRVLTIQQTTPITTKRWSKYAATDGTFNTAIVPLYIIVDVKQHVIKFQGRINILFTRQKDIPEKRLMFTFHYKDKIAEWTGLFPQHPLYGEWLWDKEIANEIRKETSGKRNKALENNEAVKKLFNKKRRENGTNEMEVITEQGSI